MYFSNHLRNVTLGFTVSQGFLYTSMTEFTWKFGERVRFIRRNIGLNQAEFGVTLSVSRQTINAYENDRQTPPLDMMQKICLQNDVAPLWLLSGLGEFKVSDDYLLPGEMGLLGGVSDTEFSSEQSALIKFITENPDRASKLARLLWDEALNSLRSEGRGLTGRHGAAENVPDETSDIQP